MPSKDPHTNRHSQRRDPNMKNCLFLKFFPFFVASVLGQGTLRKQAENSPSASDFQTQELHQDGIFEEANRNRKACVSLLVYANTECTGVPVRRLTFPTATEPGSPCYHDVSMGGYAVKDQYCDLKTGNWHETVFPSSTTCESHWYDFWSSIPLEFKPGNCVGGFELEKCSKKRCPSLDEGLNFPIVEDLIEVQDDFVPIIQHGVVVGKMKID